MIVLTHINGQTKCAWQGTKERQIAQRAVENGLTPGLYDGHLRTVEADDADLVGDELTVAVVGGDDGLVAGVLIILGEDGLRGHEHGAKQQE